MAWSQDEERMLAMIERHLTDDDPKLAARLQSFSHRAGQRGRRRGADRGTRRRMDRATVIIILSWLLIATLIATLLIMALRHDAAAFTG